LPPAPVAARRRRSRPLPPPSLSATGGWPDQPVGARLSLEFYKAQGTSIYVHADGSLTLGVINGMQDNDASPVNFVKRSGLGDSKGVSFESAALPGQYLRRWYSGVRVSGGGLFDTNFNNDATFRLTSYHRYESVGLPGYYLRVTGSAVTLSRLDSLNDPDATYDTFLFERGRLTLGLDSGSAFPANWTWVVGDVDETATLYGPCTGLTPWTGVPRSTSVSAFAWWNGLPPPLGTGIRRTITVSATSTPVYGFYPWVRFVRYHEVGPSGIYKITTGRGLCVF
jgi:hypothetical protein